MKLTFSTLACPGWNLLQIINGATANKIAGVDFRGLGPEIDITRLPEFTTTLDTTLERFATAGIALPCLNTSITLVTPAPERWHMMLDECQRYATLAERAGSRYLRVFGGAVPKGMTRDEARLLAHRHLRQLEKVCRPHGCQIIIETHDDWATSEHVLALVHEFEPDAVGVLWDIEHPFRRGEQPSDTAGWLKKYLKHVHIKDCTVENGHTVPRLLGAGDLPLSASLTALMEIGYDEWICLETEARWHPDTAPPPEESVAQFARYMREQEQRFDQGKQ